MPEILRHASDDHIALIICFGAVAVSGLIMHFSIHVGRITGRIRLHQTSRTPNAVVPEFSSVAAQRSETISVRDRAA